MTLQSTQAWWMRPHSLAVRARTSTPSTSAPICAPSRASMFTGRRTSSLEAWSNVKSLTGDVAA